MSNTRTIHDHTRKELYDLVWLKPFAQIATETGIPEETLQKRCCTLKIPRPPKRYWVGIAAGRKPRKKPLPATPNELFKEKAQRPIPKTLNLPASNAHLHPLATKLITELKKAEPDHHQRVHLRLASLPETTVSPNLAERTAKAFHVLLQYLEPLGVTFQPAQSNFDGGFFRKGNDRLYTTITESVYGADGSLHCPGWWQSQLPNTKPSGFLTFSFNPSRYGTRDAKEWHESAKIPLEQLLSQILTALRKHFLDALIQREQRARQSAKDTAEWRRQMEEWKRNEPIRLRQEAERKHAEALAIITLARKKILYQAAANWRSNRELTDFIDQCEQRWKSQAPELLPEQIAWLNWAHQIAEAASPFSVNYPDPTTDGPLDPTTIPFGGPYPPSRNSLL